MIVLKLTTMSIMAEYLILIRIKFKFNYELKQIHILKNSKIFKKA